MRLFSYKSRPVHMGPLPVERLKRLDGQVDLSLVKTRPQLTFADEGSPENLKNAMRIMAQYIDATREGHSSGQTPIVPDALDERAHQAKSLAYFMDALHVGCAKFSDGLLLPKPYFNKDLPTLHAQLGNLPEDVPGFHHMIAHHMQEGIDANDTAIKGHTHVISIVFDHYRDLKKDESGYPWLHGTGTHVASLRASEIAIVLANYLRVLGFSARAHTESTTEIDLAKAAVAAGVAEIGPDGTAIHPYAGEKFAIAVVTTDMAMAVDAPLAPRGAVDMLQSHGPSWWLGGGFGMGRGMATTKNASNLDPYKRRNFEHDVYGMHKIKRVEKTTTFIDEARVPRVPKRADGFWRGNFGDMGEYLQTQSNDEFCVIKGVVGEAQYGLIGPLHLLERRQIDMPRLPGNEDADLNAKRIKSALHYIGTDIVGISEAPEWVWYSHEHDGTEIDTSHTRAITILVDQGHETMEGASGDDWIASSQSMRAYLRGLLLGGVIAEQIRNLGYEARTHSVVDSDVLQVPLILLAGLGEMSRIGDAAMNPFLGPRLKSFTITTDMPMTPDKPIDFGLQKFCESCNKCARECPSGAISAGPKVMFNGYEAWKPDSEKCTRYRVGQTDGAMCGRCMKTCPWNLEGLFVESPFRWLAMNVPQAAKTLARLDDKVGNGRINPVKKWWWDIETTMDGTKQLVPEDRINRRDLQLDLDLKFEDQSLAAYTADVLPAPIPVVHPMNRELAIETYENLISADEYQAKLANGETEGLAPEYNIPKDAPDVQYLRITKREMQADGVVVLELENPDGSDVTPFTAGGHIDLIIDAPFTRQYSLAGDPADTSKYVVGILEEKEGRGGSIRVHERLHEGTIVPVTGPRNHFPLNESASKTLLFGGGIGITPMIAMANTLFAAGADFELHYCFRKRSTAGFIEYLESQPWADRVKLHISSEGTRADLEKLVGSPDPGTYLYTCGPNPFMDSVMTVAEQLGWNDDNIRYEYFTVPEQPDFENHPFEVTLKQSGKTLQVAEDQSLADVLMKQGLPVQTKCSDGLCGVCKVEFTAGDVEHRDFVLSKKEREHAMVTCCSRPKPDSERLILDL
ncbi:MAG: 2Fe-2S iron-sulfur cluster-binding protein [Pseudoruegeria sp.]